MSVFRSKLARYGSCAQVMPVAVSVISAISRTAPKPMYPLELPFHPEPEPFVPPAVVPMEIGEYPPKVPPLPGVILANASGFLPPGYLLCDGREVSRTTYSVLFKIIGTYYGDGDLTTTFNLPNLSNDYNTNVCYIIKYDLTSDTVPYYPPQTCDDPQPTPPTVFNIQILPYPIAYIPPPGTILQNTTPTLPDGYLICNGAEVSRVEYAILYNMIGTYYGDGNMVDTFNLPNLSSNNHAQYIIRYAQQECVSGGGGTGGNGGGTTTIVVTPPVNTPGINALQMLPYPLPYVPVPGTILLNTVALLPDGYLACNGAAVSRTTYQILFDMIGTYYGSGDGTTTFNVPHLILTGDATNKYIIRYAEPNVIVTPPVNVQGINQIQMLPYPLPYVPAVGTILLNTLSVLPDGYLACNGSSVSRSTYAALFDMIGVYYGGSGTTFQLPSLIANGDAPNKYIIRYDAQHTVVPAQPVNIQNVNQLQMLPYPLPYIPAVGTILLNTLSVLPDGYLACDGSSLSRTIYAALFEMIGVYYGTNDSSTFLLPHLIGPSDTPNKYIIRYSPPDINPVNVQGVNTIQMLPYPLPYIPPPGTILVNTVSDLPDGYLACDGAAVSRTTFSDLFSIVGVYYGAGDGTTFTLPNLIGPTDPANKYIIRYSIAGTNPANVQGVNTIQMLPYPLAYIPAVGTILSNTQNLNYAPNGYLACNGAEVERGTYIALYEMIGTYYGSGDGATTFNLPNLIGSADPPYKYIIRYDVQVIPCVTIAPNLQVTGLNLDLNSIAIN